MAKELFNQTIVAINRTKRLAFGQPSQNGCDNVLISTFQDDTRGYIKIGVMQIGQIQPIALTDSSIVGINVKYLTGSPSFRMGSTLVGKDLFPSTLIDSDIRFGVSIAKYSGNVYTAITGSGTIEVTLVVEQNLF